jgi:lysine 6-dehydrogenase
MRMLVLGAGLQGSACAYDLLQQQEVERVRLADLDVSRLPAFLEQGAGGRLETHSLDVRDHDAVRAALRGCDAALSAIPYYFNVDLAALAVEAGVHFCDLGGNTEIVLQQKALDARAREQGVTVVPDCGLAPGMVNILAQHGIEQLDTVEQVRIHVGGLPQDPQPPLNYQVVYSLEGVLDYYTTASWILRGGRRVQVEALSEVEPVTFDAPVGELEAFHTAGGLSTLAFRHEGRVPSMEYKTLRYPGHAAIMRAIRELGLLDTTPVEVNGGRVAPRDVTIASMRPRLFRPEGRDLVALRVLVSGTRGGRPATVGWELVDRYDEARGISAMMRTTGYSLSITGLMQVRGEIAPAGVYTPDECVPARAYLEALGERGIHVRPLES